MDGIHDLGGMHGFGAIARERDEPVFHAAWEGRMFALLSAVPFAVPFGDDQFRPAVEAMHPADYLAASYYEKWYAALMRLLDERGALTGPDFVPAGPPVRAEAVLPAIFGGASQAQRDAQVAQRFKTGDQVRTLQTLATGHNRLPRYARGRIGTVESIHGGFLVADRNSKGDQTPEMLYTVRFAARDLWGAAAASGDNLSLDLWDSYLLAV